MPKRLPNGKGRFLLVVVFKALERTLQPIENRTGRLPVPLVPIRDSAMGNMVGPLPLFFVSVHYKGLAEALFCKCRF